MSPTVRSNFPDDGDRRSGGRGQSSGDAPGRPAPRRFEGRADVRGEGREVSRSDGRPQRRPEGRFSGDARGGAGGGWRDDSRGVSSGDSRGDSRGDSVGQSGGGRPWGDSRVSRDEGGRGASGEWRGQRQDSRGDTRGDGRGDARRGSRYDAPGDRGPRASQQSRDGWSGGRDGGWGRGGSDGERSEGGPSRWQGSAARRGPSGGSAGGPSRGTGYAGRSSRDGESPRSGRDRWDSAGSYPRSGGAPRGRSGDWGGRSGGGFGGADRDRSTSGGDYRTNDRTNDRSVRDPRNPDRSPRRSWDDAAADMPARGDVRRVRPDGAPAAARRGAWQPDGPTRDGDRRPGGSDGRPSRPSAPRKTPKRRPDDQQPKLRKWVGLDESAGFERSAPESTAAAAATEAPARQRGRKLPDEVVDGLSTMLGARRGGKVAGALQEAAKAFERDRFNETLRILRPVVEEAPDSAPVRELYGLALYREGKWAEAVRHLTAFTELSGSTEQHPVLADCHRALRHYGTVAELWTELSESSPAAHLVAEGRIVMAGALADQGKLLEAIALLERGSLDSKRPKDHHLRMWYSLADLYERAGDVSRARERFSRIVAVQPDYVNVAERIANLG